MRPQKYQESFLIVWILYIIQGKTRTTVFPQDKEANQGDDVQFNCRVNFTVPISDADSLVFKWKHNGHWIHPHNISVTAETDAESSGKHRHQRGPLKYLVEDKGQPLLIRDVEGKDSGVYTCIVELNGQDSDMANAKLSVKEPPDAPREVSIISCTGNTVELMWRPGLDGGSPITHYLVQYNTSENQNNWNYYYEEIKGDARDAYVILQPWATYMFRLLAKNSVGYSKPSKPTKTVCTTPPERPNGNPKEVRTLTHKMGKLIITWESMPRLQHSAPGFKYQIFWRRKGSTYWNKNIVENPSAQMWEVSVNDTYKLYEFKVKSMNEIGESRQPAFNYIGYSGEGEPTVAVKDFRIDPTQPISAHQAHFIWEAVDTSEDKIKGKFRGYKLRYWKSSEGRLKWKEVDVVISPDEPSRLDVRAALDSLPAHTALRAQVFVMNTHYTGPPSDTIDFTTPEGVPGPVRDLRIEKYGSTFALLKWLPPDEPNGLLLGYDIGYQQITGDMQQSIKALRPQIDNPDTLGARITGLSSNHNYRFYVWARTAAGRGKPIYQDVMTKGGDPPDTPNAKIMQLDQTSVNITWTPYRLIGVKYDLEYRLAGDAKWKVAYPEWGHDWVVINNLLPNREYEVRLKAKNEYGDTASSTLYRVVTQPRKVSDAHQYQQDREYEHERYGPTYNSSSSRLHNAKFSIFDVRTKYLLVQTLVSLVIILGLFH